MELQHFSHIHPLMLNERQKHEDEGVTCEGCMEPISGPSYCCRNCTFSLHKKCAELSQEIKHPMHPQHPLTLYVVPPYAYGSLSRVCNACQQSLESFTYHCSLCDFDLDILCAFEECKIDHKSHDHPLTLLQRPITFDCDACGMKFEDKSYLCLTCPFMIHKSCALLPSILDNIDHDHSLTLVYSLPRKYSSFTHHCDICAEEVRPLYWAYSCTKCRFIVHVNCTSEHRGCEGEITTNKQGFGSYLSLLPLITTKKEGFVSNLNLLRLPSNNPSVDVISLFVKEMALGNNKITTCLDHFSHDHPLLLFEEQNNRMKNYETLLCKGCIRPISAPFYSCAECSFSLHKCCAELPQEVHLPWHSLSMLFKLTSHKLASNYFECDCCQEQYDGGFIFTCENDDKVYQLDVVCASILNRTLVHEGHKHPLVQCKGVLGNCKACDKPLPGTALQCEHSCWFHVHIRCALLPRSVTHRWDKHALILSYPPFTDHPEEFYCEFCEKEINPRLWIYHCRDCDQSFHLECIFLEVDTIKVDCHQHPLKCVRRTIPENVICECDGCIDPILTEHFYQCLPCNFHLCYKCADRS